MTGVRRHDRTRLTSGVRPHERHPTSRVTPDLPRGVRTSRVAPDLASGIRRHDGARPHERRPTSRAGSDVTNGARRHERRPPSRAAGRHQWGGFSRRRRSSLLSRCGAPHPRSESSTERLARHRSSTVVAAAALAPARSLAAEPCAVAAVGDEPAGVDETLPDVVTAGSADGSDARPACGSTCAGSSGAGTRVRRTDSSVPTVPDGRTARRGRREAVVMGRSSHPAGGPLLPPTCPVLLTSVPDREIRPPRAHPGRPKQAHTGARRCTRERAFPDAGTWAADTPHRGQSPGRRPTSAPAATTRSAGRRCGGQEREAVGGSVPVSRSATRSAGLRPGQRVDAAPPGSATRSARQENARVTAARTAESIRWLRRVTPSSARRASASWSRLRGAPSDCSQRTRSSSWSSL